MASKQGGKRKPPAKAKKPAAKAKKPAAKTKKPAATATKRRAAPRTPRLAERVAPAAVATALYTVWCPEEKTKLGIDLDFGVADGKADSHNDATGHHAEPRLQ